MLYNLNLILEFKNQQIIIVTLDNKIIYKQEIFNSKDVYTFNKHLTNNKRIVIKESLVHILLMLYRCGLISNDSDCIFTFLDNSFTKFLDEGRLIIKK